MAGEYKYSTVSGESWLRSKRIIIDNALDQWPTLKFVEERVLNVNTAEKFKRDEGVLNVQSSNETMAEIIPILDPTSGTDTGKTVSFAEAYAILKSAYIYYAKKRDNPPVVTEPTPPPEEPVP